MAWIIVLVVLAALAFLVERSLDGLGEKKKRESEEIRKSVVEHSEERRSQSIKHKITATERDEAEKIIGKKSGSREELKKSADLIYRKSAVERTKEQLSSEDRQVQRRAAMALTNDAEYVVENWPGSQHGELKQVGDMREKYKPIVDSWMADSDVKAFDTAEITNETVNSITVEDRRPNGTWAVETITETFGHLVIEARGSGPDGEFELTTEVEVIADRDKMFENIGKEIRESTQEARR